MSCPYNDPDCGRIGGSYINECPRCAQAQRFAEGASVVAEELGDCPFCKGKLSASRLPDGTHDSINHTMPPCDRYLELDALAFVIAVNVEKAKQAGTPGLS